MLGAQVDDRARLAHQIRTLRRISFRTCIVVLGVVHHHDGSQIPGPQVVLGQIFRQHKAVELIHHSTGYPSHVADTIRRLGSATSTTKNINAVLTHDKGSLLVGRDGEGTVHFAHVPLQVTWENRMNVDHHDTEFPGLHVLLMREICIKGDKNVERPLGRREEPVIVVILPSLIPGRLPPRVRPETGHASREARRDREGPSCRNLSSSFVLVTEFLPIDLPDELGGYVVLLNEVFDRVSVV